MTSRMSTYRIIHFATHGLLASETEIDAGGPPEPALVLTPPNAPSQEDDGLLTAGEILQLRLNADWVILSACNTAGGERTGADATEVERGLKTDQRIGSRAYLHAGGAFAGGTLARDILFLRSAAGAGAATHWRRAAV